MGFKNYFKAGKPAPQNSNPTLAVTPAADQHYNEKEDYGPMDRAGASGSSTPGGLMSSRASMAQSTFSGKSSFMDDIRHEVMVNYLFQQQCARLWVGDGSGEVEGVLLRKFRGSYLACPPALSQSIFAMACAALNVPVSWLPSDIAFTSKVTDSFSSAP